MSHRPAFASLGMWVEWLALEGTRYKIRWCEESRKVRTTPFQLTQDSIFKLFCVPICPSGLVPAHANQTTSHHEQRRTMLSTPSSKWECRPQSGCRMTCFWLLPWNTHAWRATRGILFLSGMAGATFYFFSLHFVHVRMIKGPKSSL